MRKEIMKMTDTAGKITDNEAYFQPPVVVPQMKFSVKESIFALIFSFTGYFFIKTFIMNSPGMGAAIFMLCTAAAAAAFSKLTGAKSSRYSRLYLVLTFIFSANLAITSNGLIMFLDFMFAAIMLAMWAFATNNPDWKGADDLFIFSFGSAVFGRSFGNFGKCPSAASELLKRNKGGRNIRNIFLGILAAVPVTLVVITILSSADSAFGDIMGELADGISLSGLFRYMCGLPLSFLVFGIVYGGVSAKGKCPDRLKCEKTAAAFRIAPSVMMYSSVVPLCIVYVIFFFSQLTYFTSAFRGVLPEEFSAAEYARKGFFELCAVSVINLFVIAAINVFCRYDGKGGEKARPAALKFFTALLSVFTLILIATALSKMGMYIARFGLTPKRVYTSWFMVVLAALFILIAARQFKAFNMAKTGAVIFTVMLALLSFSRTDSLIAGYNISAYEKGIIEEISFDGLSCDAVYAVKGCLDSGNAALKEEAESWLEQQTNRSKYYEWYEKSVSEYAAYSK